ncbi:hypothetical protein FNJ88_09390 [Chryseobacterium sp. SNU WT5]|uniref:hypothetical protein n=1 Tax=Chryseobacterium sp. SNU WT5 TaxID=2594269 RepID=UPI00117F79D1|nr:hypothetical protein [Chryseobacterium sp. SNU WT5]QDP85749.1 hypothetical protein FNJ88_09390 [Chryseobacterium sp. SNU WT5]
MKKIYSLLFLAIFPAAKAQVIIGDVIGTAPSNKKGSVLLEFANTNNKGLVLPYLRTLPTTPAEGTIVLDASSANAARVKYYNGGWIDLSNQNGIVTSSLNQQPTIAKAPELPAAKSIIGSSSSTADGVLVLESTTKALVLPQVTTVENIINPAPGMMVYINKDGAKRLAVFNGSKWSFWKP